MVRGTGQRPGRNHWATVMLAGRGLVGRGGDDRGATAVEFALLFPVLGLALGGMLEGGLVLYSWGRMEHVALQAGRAVSVGEATPAQARQFVIEQLRQSPGSPLVEVSVDTTTGGTTLDREVVVEVTLPFSEISAILPFGIFRFGDLRTTVRLFQES
jgi:Flp pilus assembly protein TadG